MKYNGYVKLLGVNEVYYGQSENGEFLFHPATELLAVPVNCASNPAHQPS